MSDASDTFYMDVDYAGRAGPLFGLSLKTLFLTVLTLGIYRFWMKTRMRRYYWSSVQPGGAPFEYTGTGLEKLLGFLIAAVFLVVYLALINLFLSFVGMSFFNGNPLALNLSILAAVPLIYYARYRARRYILSRTTWRGLRFGADQAAGKYMLSALGHTFLSIITLGILIPRQTFYLEKFVTDRTWYGDLKFEQHGNWKMLLRPWLLFLGVLILIIAVGGGGAMATGSPIVPVIAAFLFYGWMLIGLVYYSVASFRILAAHKVVGQNIRFDSKIRTGRVLGIYLLGFLGIFAAALAVAAVVGLVFGMSIGFNFTPETIESLAMGDTSGIIALVVGALAYFAFLLFLGALAQVLFVQPLLRHYAVETIILNADEIDTASQRPHDQNVEAEGFADALDVGAAI